MRNLLEAAKAAALSVLLCALVLLTSPPANAWLTRDWAVVSPGVNGEMFSIDMDDNVYVAASVPWSQMLISKYSASGQTLWTRVFDLPGTREQSAWIAVDPRGNAIVTGYIIGDQGSAAIGLIVLKYSPDGTLIWQDVVRSASGYASRAETDDAGNVYVAARSWPTRLGAGPHGGIAFDRVPADAPASILVTRTGSVVVIGGTDGKMMLAACDLTGNVISSTELAASPGDIAVGPSGEVYVVSGPRSSPAASGFLIVKYDPQFNELWRRAYPVGRWAWRVTVDSLGNPIVAGVAGEGSLHWMTIKLDPQGSLLWTRSYDGHPSRDEIPFSIAIGSDDSVFITGQAGTQRRPDAPPDLNTATVTLKYSGDGELLWSASEPSTNRGLAAKLGRDDGVFVIGESPLTIFHYKRNSH
jgi:hypothetical protein